MILDINDDDVEVVPGVPRFGRKGVLLRVGEQIDDSRGGTLGQFGSLQ